MTSFKLKENDENLPIINNKIRVCRDCLGLRFGRCNIPDDDHKLTVLGAAIELKCIVNYNVS